MDGRAIVYCEGSFGNEYGKTAHGLVRQTARYDVVAVIDSELAGVDAGTYLDNSPKGIPVEATLADALNNSEADYFVIGMAPDGGVLSADARRAVIEAMRNGLNVDSGLHEFLSDDTQLAEIATEANVIIRDVRKPPPRSELHFFSGAIKNVRAKRIAVLGTDCAVGKRTTATLLVNALNEASLNSELIGTGQTSWLQGVRYGFMLDSTVNDFVGGELEHAIVSADENESPDVIVIEGQACLTHPAGAGGFEILGSGLPHGVILQHAPGRKVHSGYDDFPVVSLQTHIDAMESLFQTHVIGIGINPEGLDASSVAALAADYERQFGVPCCNPLVDGVARFVEAVKGL